MNGKITIFSPILNVYQLKEGLESWNPRSDDDNPQKYLLPKNEAIDRNYK
jgi:hypothetical protein